MTYSLSFGLVDNAYRISNKKYWYSKNGGVRCYTDDIFSVFKNYIPKLIEISPKGFDGEDFLKHMNVFILNGYQINMTRQKNKNLYHYTTGGYNVAAFGIHLKNDLVARNKRAARDRRLSILQMAEDFKTKGKIKKKPPLDEEAEDRWNLIKERFR